MNKTKNNTFSIIIPCRNCEEYIERCITSIVQQDYPKDLFEILVTDDASTDKTPYIMRDLWVKYNNKFADYWKIRISLFRNQDRLYALHNIDRMVKEAKNDIIVVVDGDDALLNKITLLTLNNYYEDENCWTTYGDCFSTNNMPYNWQIPYEVIERNSFRKDIWGFSHPCTFRKSLYEKIPKNYFEDSKGSWLKYSYDKALQISLLELAGFRSRFITEKLYYYNAESSCNVHKTNCDEQGACLQEVLKKKPLERIQCL